MDTSWKPRVRAWVNRYLAGVNLAGFAFAWAWALAQPGNMLDGSPGYAPLRILPEPAWLLLMLILGSAQLGPAILGWWRPAPYRRWRMAWTGAGAVVWGGLGWQLGQYPVVSAGMYVYLWLGTTHLIRIAAAEWTED